MALISYYDTGFATVANGSRDITGTGTQWLSSLRENDVFVGKDGRSARIGAVLSNTSLRLARNWPGDSQTSDVYEVRITPAPSEITASVRELLEKLRQGLWLTPNATGTLAERAAYDSARRGFIYMRTDVNPFVVFVKQTDTEADWSPGFSPQQGPSGPFTTIEIGTTTTLDPGEQATISPVQDGDVVTLNFGIPAGTVIEAGTTTTIAPDQPASVDFDPIPGGFQLNFSIPRGPTGDIDGVTDFWVTRLGSDADAAAARAGLGATDVGDEVFTAGDASAARAALDAPSNSDLAGRSTGQIVTKPFTASGVWTPNSAATLKAIRVRMVGGGGGAGGCGSGAAGGGGGAGGFSEKTVLAAALTLTGETVTVGAGGNGGSAVPGNGGNGGSSFFGAHCSATGGTGGQSSNGTGGPYPGGVGTGGNLNIRGGSGGNRSAVEIPGTPVGGNSFFGASDALMLTTGNYNSSVLDRAAPGAGGLGPRANAGSGPYAGQAGGNGLIVIEELY